ncbi:hypothetical protein EYF80_029868 [Liparis tanakae]|uniref:Uncharacterized protein n=1 Tax=Liparis tanakae TaxID=230148 RepID=A0A4Z2H4R5_9TELE|nr:hypothetical protein EYF80_029868 [Liparis tanakae]
MSTDTVCSSARTAKAKTAPVHSSRAKLQAVEHDEAVGGVKFTGILRVALKIPGALPQPQLPDLSYVHWRRQGRREGRQRSGQNNRSPLLVFIGSKRAVLGRFRTILNQRAERRNLVPIRAACMCRGHRPAGSSNRDGKRDAAR